jgi:hypothetical protein
MLTLVTKVLEDGYRHMFYTYTQQGDKICFGVKTAEELKNMIETDRNYTIDINNVVRFYNTIDKERIFRDSAQDYITLQYDENKTLFWLLDRLIGSINVDTHGVREEFKYSIGNRLNTIIIGEERLKISQELLFEKDTVPEDLISLGMLKDDLVAFNLSEFNVTNMDEDVASTILTPSILDQFYIYTAVPLICEDCCFEILNLRSIETNLETDTLIELKLYRTRFNDETSLKDRMHYLKHSTKPIDNVRADLLRKLNKYSDADLVQIIKELKQELHNRKKLLFKMKYIYRRSNEEHVLVRNNYGKLEMKEAI